MAKYRQDARNKKNRNVNGQGHTSYHIPNSSLQNLTLFLLSSQEAAGQTNEGIRSTNIDLLPPQPQRLIIRDGGEQTGGSVVHEVPDQSLVPLEGREGGKKGRRRKVGKGRREYDCRVLICFSDTKKLSEPLSFL